MPLSAGAQSLLTFAGGTMSGSGLEVSWSVGEIIITTTKDGEVIATQGYQQPVENLEDVLTTDSTYNFITANGDDINDYFLIQDVENMSDNRLVIINRWREVVYQTEHYQNDWNGRQGDHLLPQATYYYTFYPDKTSRKCRRGTIHVLHE